MKRKASLVILQALIIGVVAVVLGIGANALRAEGLGLSSKDGPCGILQLDLKGAKELFDQGKAVFLDSRTPAEYEAGRIKGAIRLPVDEFEDKFLDVLDKYEMTTPFVVYCSGEDCNSSDLLANKMKEEGYQRVYVFFGGWPAWKKASYPSAGQPKAFVPYKMD